MCPGDRSSHRRCGLEQIPADPKSVWSASRVDPPGGEMIETPVLPFVRLGMKRPPPAACRPRSDSSVAWSPERNQPVEIVTPDQYLRRPAVGVRRPDRSCRARSGRWLDRRAAGAPAGTGGCWMLEVLSLLDRWLESVPLPCATVFYGGHSYLIRSSIETAQHGPTSRSAFAAAHALAH